MTHESSARSGVQTRRNVVRGLGAGALVTSLGLRPKFAEASDRPLRIGCLNTFTKSWAAFGADTLRGFDLYLENANWKLAGRAVELLKEDDEMTPQTGLQKVRKLVEADGVDVICGPLASNVAGAMVDYMKTTDCIWIITGAGADQLTYAGLPNMFRNTLSFWQVAHALGAWTYDHVAKGGAVSANDYVGGHDAVDDFKEGLLGKGGEITQEFYPPFGTTDFSAYLSNLRAQQPQFSFNFYGGTDAVRFLKQYEQYGLKQGTQFIGFASTLDNDTFVGLGRTALGCLSGGIYCDSVDNPANKAFVRAYRAKYGNEFPSWNAESAFSSCMILEGALKSLGSNVNDRAALAKAIEQIKIEAPRGPLSFDRTTHQAIQNVYIRKVVEIDGRVANTVVDTISNVGPGPRHRA